MNATITTLELTSEDLYFATSKSGLTHVNDVSEDCRCNITMCGRPIAGMVIAPAERSRPAEKVCTRCLESLRAEMRWGVRNRPRVPRWKLTH